MNSNVLETLCILLNIPKCLNLNSFGSLYNAAGFLVLIFREQVTQRYSLKESHKGQCFIDLVLKWGRKKTPYEKAIKSGSMFNIALPSS